MSEGLEPVARPAVDGDAARRHLLLSFPALEAGASGPEVVCRLMEAAIHRVLQGKAANSLLTVEDVRATIRSMTGLQYDSAEVIAALTRLEAQGHVGFKHAERRAFVFSEKRQHELNGDLAYRQERMEAVRKEWVEDVRLRHGLTDEQLTPLWIALDEFIARLMNTYAAEAAAFLYQAEHGTERFADVLSQRLPRVSDVVGPDLVDVAQPEFKRFFDQATAARTDYLVHRLRSAFHFHLLNIDPGASQLVQEHVSDKVFYLDTNFLFRLLGFDGPTEAYAPQAAVEMCRALKCTLLVAGETLGEFVRRLRAEMKSIRQYAVTQETLQRVAANQPGDEYAFMRAYYAEVLSGKVRTADQFENKYTNLKSILSQYGIRIDEDAELTEEEVRSDSFLDMVSRLKGSLNFERHPDSLEHDVFLLRMVRAKRGKRDRGAGSIKLWILTYDRTLTRFSVRESTADALPACLLADDWLQIARPFLPRTADYDRSFVSMLQHPLAFEGVDVVPLADMAQALHRLDALRDTPAPVLAAMVSDSAMLERVRSARDQTEVKKLVESEAIKFASQMEQEKQRLTQHSRELVDRVEQMEKVVGTLRERLTDSSGTVTQRTRERDEARTALARLEEQVPNEVSKAREEAEREAENRLTARVNEAVAQALQARSDADRTRLRKLGWYAVGALVIAATIRMMIVAPAAHEGFGLPVSLSVILATGYACYVYAEKGWSHDSGSRIANVLGVIGFVLFALQQFAAFMPPKKAPGDVKQPSAGSPQEQQLATPPPTTAGASAAPGAGQRSSPSQGTKGNFVTSARGV
jgi:hypothetical protein